MKTATLNHVSAGQRVGLILASVTAFLTAATAAGMLYADEVFADGISDAAKKADTGIWTTAKTLVPSLLGICVVIGGILLVIGGERGKEGVKTKAGVVLIGVGMIIFAPSIVKAVTGWLA